MNSSATIGEQLRRRRHSLGLTLEQVSSGICSTSLLSLIEQGHRNPSDRMGELLLARLNASESDSGIQVQLAALRVAEHEARHNGGLSDQAKAAPALKQHRLFLQALEAEASSEPSTALAALEPWLEANTNSRDMQSYGARIRIRLLRAAGRDAEAMAFGAKLLASADLSIKSRQDDLLQIALQVAALYNAAGQARDALRVLEQHRALAIEPRQIVDSHWTAADAAYARGDVGSALAETRSALEAVRSIDTPAGLGALENNLIHYQLLNGELDEPAQRKQLLELEGAARQVNDAEQLSLVYSTLALLEARLGNNAAFVSAAEDSLRFLLNRESRGFDSRLVSMAEIAMSCGEPTYAEQLLAQLDARTRQVPTIRAEALVLYRAGRVASRLGDFERGNEYYAAAFALLGFVSVVA